MPNPATTADLEARWRTLTAQERVNATALPWIVALRAAGKPVRAINHHGVEHAFHNDTSAERYNAEAAARAWRETLAFFARHLQ